MPKPQGCTSKKKLLRYHNFLFPKWRPHIESQARYQDQPRSSPLSKASSSIRRKRRALTFASKLSPQCPSPKGAHQRRSYSDIIISFFQNGAPILKAKHVTKINLVHRPYLKLPQAYGVNAERLPLPQNSALNTQASK